MNLCKECEHLEKRGVITCASQPTAEVQGGTRNYSYCLFRQINMNNLLVKTCPQFSKIKFINKPKPQDHV